MKICMDCKWCSYNYEQQRIKAIKNPIKRFFADMSFCKNIEFRFPECKHPEVYFNDIDEERVRGKLSRKEIFCLSARLENHGSFHCCGKEGKFFEEYKK